MSDLWGGLGLEQHRVAHARVTADWLTIGSALADEVSAALGIERSRVQHVGSTAVIGLLAKPIIDLAVGLDDGLPLAHLERVLPESGWEYRGDAGDDGGHLFVLETAPLVRVAHLHGVAHEGTQWRRYLMLRSRLRDDEAARAAYEATKLRLVAEHGDDRVAYTEGKTATVRDILDGA